MGSPPLLSRLGQETLAGSAGNILRIYGVVERRHGGCGQASIENVDDARVKRTRAGEEGKAEGMCERDSGANGEGRLHVGTVRLVGAVALIVVALIVAGCGVTTAPTRVSSQEATPSPANSTATARVAPPTTAPTRTAISASATPCPATDQSAGNPALILTPTTPDRSGSAHIGDLAQVRLPTTTKWTFQSSAPVGTLAVAQPSGVLIHAVNACVWSFQATAAGTTSVSFIGQPLCEPGKPCPNYRIAMTFTITIS